MSEETLNEEVYENKNYIWNEIGNCTQMFHKNKNGKGFLLTKINK